MFIGPAPHPLCCYARDYCLVMFLDLFISTPLRAR